MKKCIKCKENKSYDHFYKQSSGKLKNSCKKCDKKRILDWQRKNKDKKASYNKTWKEKDPTYTNLVYLKSSLKHNYGISVEQYNKLQKRQNGKCKICNKIKKLVIDRCHKTGVVRGLLCYKCNTALGMFEDNKELFKSAIKYLENT